jgi:hypothetical protein
VKLLHDVDVLCVVTANFESVLRRNHKESLYDKFTLIFILTEKN